MLDFPAGSGRIGGMPCRLFLLFSCLILAIPLHATAQSRVVMRQVKGSSGTGFYINRDGHLITNDHVVRGCQMIFVHGEAGRHAATIVASDAQRDLAVLKVADAAPRAIAPLRWNIGDLKIGDMLYIYGFPGKEGAAGKSSFARAKLLDMKGAHGTPHWLQLEAAARQGNSGGPVIDASGNVIAVVVGRTEYYAQPTRSGEQPKLIGQVGNAITLAALQDFLRYHRINFYQHTSGQVGRSDMILEQSARQFTVPVFCVQQLL